MPRARMRKSYKPRARALLRFKYRPQYGVIVICADEAEQRRVFSRLTREQLKCKVVVV